MIAIIRMIVLGLIVGILARFFYPGAVPLGLIMSSVLGIAGSFVGGFLGRLIQPSGADDPLHSAGILLSIIGAMILIFICRNVLHIA
jgi:uncharacterized membrane protein YeaQ/YmgE (transglycosylase-associated protein family)